MEEIYSILFRDADESTDNQGMFAQVLTMTSFINKVSR
jgi:hypothetical protein